MYGFIYIYIYIQLSLTNCFYKLLMCKLYIYIYIYLGSYCYQVITTYLIVPVSVSVPVISDIWRQTPKRIINNNNIIIINQIQQNQIKNITELN